MNNIIRQIKERHPIQRFVAPHTRGLKNSDGGKGEWFIGYCPFHTHGYKRPNFWVNIKTQTCNCFIPGCKAETPMDVINFYARLHNLTNLDAIGELYRG